MSQEAQITYLVANYDNGCFIQDCIESLYAQTNPAWHCLIAEAPTYIVGVLDADDALYPETTAVLLETYTKNPQAGFVYSNWTEYSADLRTPLRSGDSRPIPPGWTSLARAG